mmetsp:Transcript_42748/g.118023  ORF Transcript_42748/g.118023 Transcript_42748/m.118023 type:complete len:323 (-) Transcript_42748:2886-3854(-)
MKELQDESCIRSPRNTANSSPRCPPGRGCGRRGLRVTAASRRTEGASPRCSPRAWRSIDAGSRPVILRLRPATLRVRQELHPACKSRSAWRSVKTKITEHTSCATKAGVGGAATAEGTATGAAAGGAEALLGAAAGTAISAAARCTPGAADAAVRSHTLAGAASTGVASIQRRPLDVTSLAPKRGSGGGCSPRKRLTTAKGSLARRRARRPTARTWVPHARHNAPRSCLRRTSADHRAIALRRRPWGGAARSAAWRRCLRRKPAAVPLAGLLRGTPRLLQRRTGGDAGGGGGDSGATDASTRHRMPRNRAACADRAAASRMG